MIMIVIILVSDLSGSFISFISCMNLKVPTHSFHIIL